MQQGFKKSTKVEKFHKTWQDCNKSNSNVTSLKETEADLTNDSQNTTKSPQIKEHPRKTQEKLTKLKQNQQN